MLILLFHAPGNGASKCQQSTIDLLIVRYKDTPVDQVRMDLAKRSKGNGQPLLVKVEKSNRPTEFFVAFDGCLLETQTGDATKALIMLFCSFYVFSLQYPAPLYPFYRFMEKVVGVKKLGIGMTGAMNVFHRKLFPNASEPETAQIAGSGVVSGPSKRPNASGVVSGPSKRRNASENQSVQIAGSGVSGPIKRYMVPIPIGGGANRSKTYTTSDVEEIDENEDDSHQLSTANSPGIATLAALLEPDPPSSLPLRPPQQARPSTQALKKILFPNKNRTPPGSSASASQSSANCDEDELLL